MNTQRPVRRGLFVRIIWSFVGGVMLFMVAAAALTFLYTRGGGAAWVSEVVDTIDEHNDAIVDTLARLPKQAQTKAERRRQRQGAKEAGPPTPPGFEALAEISERLSDTLDAHVHIVPTRGLKNLRRRGLRLPANLQLDQKQRRALRRGSPVIVQHNWRPPRVVWRAFDESEQRVVAFVVVDRRRNPPLALAAGIGLLLLSLLAVAWPLARSLTGRLRELERTTRAFAAGELDARAQIAPRDDEVDQLAASFNDMAQRIASLIHGQRTLLTNVSHELRTPLARMRVLLEILEEKATRPPYGEDPGVQRVREGLAELGQDVHEMNQLVEDLLTSGRLELGRAIERRSVALADIGARMAAKYDAHFVAAEPLPNVHGDPLLLERVLSNLLANARRACPDGRIEVDVQREGQDFVLSVQDEGHGVPPERREEIFEPFTRLDSARSRDAGGVGLGLYLCRQVAKAHGGTLRCIDRPDGERGARFELRAPLSVEAAVAPPPATSANA